MYAKTSNENSGTKRETERECIEIYLPFTFLIEAAPKAPKSAPAPAPAPAPASRRHPVFEHDLGVLEARLRQRQDMLAKHRSKLSQHECETIDRRHLGITGIIEKQVRQDPRLDAIVGYSQNKPPGQPSRVPPGNAVPWMPNADPDADPEMAELFEAFRKPRRVGTLPKGIKYDISRTGEDFNVKVHVPQQLISVVEAPE